VSEVTNADIIRAYSTIPQSAIENFGNQGDFTRRHLLNPVIFDLLDAVEGRVILDAGCGQGYLCRLLAAQGATVLGVEPSEAFFAYATRREQAERRGITYIQADLSTWIPPVDTCDAAILNMVLMDIPDYTPALVACVAALKPGGVLIVSLIHPCFEEAGEAWRSKGYVETRDYFRERAIAQTYGYFIHRPLGTYLNSIITAGCTLSHVIEPQLDRTVAERHGAERYWSVPGYLVIAATRLPVAVSSPRN